MSTPVQWEPTARDGPARSGTLTTPHGVVATPGFMPVGTRGTVKAVDGDDLTALGVEMVLANTYHLMLRPGTDVVAGLGGLHRFMAWEGPILTDSGGYQVFSLAPRLTEDGVTFRSTYDGAAVGLTPEEAVAVQEALGSDVAMTLDVLIGLPAPREDVAEAMERTLRWAERSRRARRREDTALFGIVQGGADPELRARSAAETAAIGFDGYGIGGLSVGESAAERDAALDAAIPELPEDATRYVMGLGDTVGMLAAVGKGADLFDCVLPTRLARHGKVLHPDGDFSIRRSELAAAAEPLDAACPCPTCRRYSRAYLRHLFTTRELAGLRLLTLHNLAYTLELMRRAREAISSGSFREFAAATVGRRNEA